MNPINRIGQKVVCITDKKIWLAACPVMTSLPSEGEVYTVLGFGTIDLGNGETSPGIHLLELGGLTCPCVGYNNEVWPISAFRPVSERKTDISCFEKHLKRRTKFPPDGWNDERFDEADGPSKHLKQFPPDYKPEKVR